MLVDIQTWMLSLKVPKDHMLLFLCIFVFRNVDINKYYQPHHILNVYIHNKDIISV